MNEEIIIDGYNLIRQSQVLTHSESIDLETARDHLIKLLCDYKKLKRKKIAVVFDGWKSGNLAKHTHMERGIRVIFSKDGQKADDLIKNIARDSKREIIIVTSDNDIKDFSEKNGCVVISSPDFMNKIEMAQYMKIKGVETDDDDDGNPKISTRKKGNPRKLPKNERKRKRRLKKL